MPSIIYVVLYMFVNYASYYYKNDQYQYRFQIYIYFCVNIFPYRNEYFGDVLRRVWQEDFLRFITENVVWRFETSTGVCNVIRVMPKYTRYIYRYRQNVRIYKFFDFIAYSFFFYRISFNDRFYIVIENAGEFPG